jgi:hypothetical protein
MKPFSLAAFIICVVSLIPACDRYADKTGARYISIHYAGGMPALQLTSESSNSEDDKILWKDPSLSPSIRMQQLKMASEYAQFLVARGPQFQEPINFDAENLSLSALLDKLGQASGTSIPFDLNSTITERISVKARRYYPEAILNRVIEFYGLKASFVNSRLILTDPKNP